MLKKYYVLGLSLLLVTITAASKTDRLHHFKHSKENAQSILPGGCIVNLEDLNPEDLNKLRTFTLKKEFYESKAWGLHTAVDLKNCNPELIRSSSALEQYIKQLCDLIEMKRFGEPHIVHFGDNDRVAGYSMTQLIETSLVSGHFANATNAAYIDIFSCKFYDPYMVAEFTKTFFQATSYKITATLRK